MEASCHGIAWVRVMISRAAYKWSQDGCRLGLTSACYSESLPSVWFWFRRKVVCKPNKQSRMEYPNDRKQNSFGMLVGFLQISFFDGSPEVSAQEGAQWTRMLLVGGFVSEEHGLCLPKACSTLAPSSNSEQLIIFGGGGN